MSTANFVTMRDFDLYAIDLEYPAEYPDFLDLLYALDLDNRNSDLDFHRIHVVPGYYCGDQVFVETLDSFRDFDDDDADYFLGMTRRVLLEKYDAEIEEIRRWMEKTLPALGFVKLRCVGVYSNGEAVYEIAA